MKRMRLWHSCLALVAIISVLTLGVLVSTPMEADAYADMTEGNCAQCHEDGRKAPGKTGGAEEPAKPAEPSKPVDPSKPAQSTQPIEPAKPAEPNQSTQPSQQTLPAQTATEAPQEPAGLAEAQKVNNTLPVVGLVGSVIVLGGASYLDRRKKQ